MEAKIFIMMVEELNLIAGKQKRITDNGGWILKLGENLLESVDAEYQELRLERRGIAIFI
jgi:hypothetical protein